MFLRFLYDLNICYVCMMFYDFLLFGCIIYLLYIYMFFSKYMVKLFEVYCLYVFIIII